MDAPTVQLRTILEHATCDISATTGNFGTILDPTVTLYPIPNPNPNPNPNPMWSLDLFWMQNSKKYHEQYKNGAMMQKEQHRVFQRGPPP